MGKSKLKSNITDQKTVYLVGKIDIEEHERGSLDKEMIAL